VGLFTEEEITWEIIPNPGSTKIYTSGCPKNQNRWANKTGSPPPLGSKKEVLKLRSVNNIVIPPAKTGRETTKRIAVKKTPHTNKGNFSHVTEGDRRLIIVHKKLIEPPMLEAPAICILKIPKSTPIPWCPTRLERGG